MGNTMYIQLTSPKAASLLFGLEELNLIKVISKPETVSTQRLSAKYRNSISKEQAQNLHEHIKQMRNEWNAI